MAPVYASDDLSVPSSSTVITTTSNGTAGQRSPQLGASSLGLGVASGSSFQLSQDGAVGLGQRPRTPSPSTSPQEAFFPQNLPSQVSHPSSLPVKGAVNVGADPSPHRPVLMGTSTITTPTPIQRVWAVPPPCPSRAVEVPRR